MSVRCRSAEKRVQVCFQGGGVFEFALPHREDLPAGSFQPEALLGVPVPGPRTLGCPEFGVAFGGVPARAAIVEMPEAAIDEDDLAPAGEYEIRAAWQPPAACGTVQSITVALGMEQPAHQHFRFGVLAADAGHIPAPLLGRELVRHEG